MKKQIIALLSSLTLGFTIGLLYLGFTAAVDVSQDYIWFDLFDVTNNKVYIIPLAIAGGLLMAGALKLFKQTSKKSGLSIKDLSSLKNISPTWVVTSLALGYISLVAGASLGPEAILMPLSFAIGILFAGMYSIEQKKVFGLLAVIAMLAAFFNSWYAGLLPLCLIAINKKIDIKQTLKLILLGLLAVFGSLAALNLLQHKSGYLVLDSFGSISISPKLLLLSFVVSAAVTLLPLFAHKVTFKIQKMFSILPNKWLLQGLIAGAGLATMYYLLGPVAFFSGSSGISELIANNSEYTSLQLAGLAVGKILITAWCLGTIFRGGIVFPLLLSGVSVSLLLSGGIPDINWLVALLISTFFGIFYGAFGSFAIAVTFVLSLFGFAAWPLLLAAAFGSFVVKKLYKKPISETLAI